MKAYASYLYKLLKLGDTTFPIPVFQRNYDWSEEDCTQFFCDVEKIAKTGKKHFLGMITYQSVDNSSEPYCTIIDGQQRLTTSMLFLKAICNFTRDETLRKKITSSFLINTEEETSKIKLKQIESDSTVFEKLIFDEALTTEEQESTIYRNYNLLYELIYKSDVELHELYNAFHKLEIIDVNIDEEDEDAQAIFESMNSTGKSLTGVDLLRNYFLMNMKHNLQERLYKNYWLPIERNVGKDNLEEFIIQYLIMKRKSDSIYLHKKPQKINRSTVYEAYKQQSTNTTEMLKDMHHFSCIYNTLTAKEQINEIEKLTYELIYELNCMPSLIFLMVLYDEYQRNEISQQTLTEAIKACITFVMRSKMIKGKQSNQFFASCIQIYENAEGDTISKVWEALSSGRGMYRLPNNKEFFDAVINRNIYLDFKPQYIEYILYKLEANETKEIVANKDASIEHILPQNTKNWKEYLKEKGDAEYEENIHKIGNLTLTKYNSEISNKSFEKKKEFYKTSNYKITRRINEFSSWDSATIQYRTKKIAEKALTIWEMPEINFKTTNIVDSMTDYVKTLYDELLLIVYAFCPYAEEKFTKNYINIVINEKPILSIVPTKDHINLTYRSTLPLQNAEDVSNKWHYGIGNCLTKIYHIDDMYMISDILRMLDVEQE